MTLEETDYLLFTFVLKKPYFLIFHTYKLFLNIICFYYKIIKKLYIRTIIGSSGSDCVLIKAGLFGGNLFWVGQYGHPPPPPLIFIFGEKLIQY